jgi:malic enzyme
MGAVVSEAAEITEEMFSIASRTMAECVRPERLDAGAIYPHQSELREVSYKIACAVVRYARDHNIGRHIPDDKVEEVVRSATWEPDYVPVMHVP